MIYFGLTAESKEKEKQSLCIHIYTHSFVYTVHNSVLNFAYHVLFWHDDSKTKIKKNKTTAQNEAEAASKQRTKTDVMYVVVLYRRFA